MSRQNIIYVNSLGKDLSFYLTSISAPISTFPIIEEDLNVETPIGATLFFQRLQSISPLSSLKGLIFIYCHPPDLCHSFYNFRQRCREVCEENGIICHFSYIKTFMAFVGLSMSKVKVFDGETIILVSPRGDPVTVWSIIFRDGKYFIEDYRTLPWASDPYNWRNEVIGFRVPNKVVFLRISSESNLRNLVRAFKDMNPIIPNSTYVGYIAKAVVELVQGLSGEISHFYRVIPLIQVLFLATETKPLGKISNADAIPSSLSIPIPQGEAIFCGIRTVDIHMQEFDDDRHQIDLSQFAKTNVDIILKVDADGFFEYEIEPKYLTSDSMRGKLILFNDFLSVIIWKKDGVEEVLEGLQKVSYYVNFAEKVATFGEMTQESAKENPSFVVFDFIKLLSLTSPEASADSSWPFLLTSNSEHSVLVDVDTVAGKRQYTPPFIFALFCKWIILQIKKGTGTFLDELEVEFKMDEIKQVLKENIIASFRMLKIKLKLV
uniref:Uncharacterized protein n=1 Tax=Panagrolaimus sp. ES5 TaxID=591445 RepID=A0AC34GNX5_9BILA